MKIGFLALSGIRAHDPDLLALGLTLPGFVNRSKAIAALPSLGLLYLAACTPDGHELHYFEAEADGTEPAEVYTCDLVAISTFSAQVFEAYAIARRLRAAGVRVAMGGLHVTVLPEEAAARRRLRDCRRRRARLAGDRGRGTAWRTRPHLPCGGLSPGRCGEPAGPALRSAGQPPLQPVYRPDITRLSVAM